MTSRVAAISIAGGLMAAAVGFLLWSVNYALAYRLLLKRWDMWTAIGAGDWFAPVGQAMAYWGDPAVRKLVTLALAGTVVELAIGAGCVALLILQPWRIKPPEDGSRFGTLADLKKAGLLDGKPGYSVLLGTFKGRDVRYSGDSHFFVNGPSRSGKGRGFVMTNLLEWAGSVIVLDVKLENWKKTGPARAAMGQEMFLFSPGSEQSHRWNPLDFVRPWPARATDLGNLAAALIPPPERGESYWAETAQGLLASLMAYVLESPTMEGRRTLRSVQRMFGSGMSLSDRMEAILGVELELNTFIRDNFEQHIAREEKQKAAFESNVTTNLKAWNNRLLADVTSASDFDIRDLRRKRMSIFIGAPVSDFATVEPIIRLFIQQVHDVLLRQEPGSDEPHKLLLMLDEFYQFGRLPEIVVRAPLVAGYGFRIAIIAQNLPQLDERYTKVTREALVGNMDVRLYVAVGDDTTADAVSRDFGRQYVERQGWSQGGGRRSVQGRWEPLPLISPDAVKRLDDRKTLLQVRGHHGVILDKLNFYTQPRFTKAVDIAASYDTFLQVPVVPAIGEWPLNEARPATIVSAEQNGSTADDVDAKSWAAIETLAGQVLRTPAGFLRRLRAAMDHADDAGVAVIAHELRTNPSLCGELAGGERLCRPDRARTHGLEAAKALRATLIALRRRRNDRDAASYRASIRAGSTPYVKSKQPAPTELDGSINAPPDANDDAEEVSLDAAGKAMADLVGASVAPDSDRSQLFTSLRKRLSADLEEFAEAGSAGVIMTAD